MSLHFGRKLSTAPGRSARPRSSGISPETSGHTSASMFRASSTWLGATRRRSRSGIRGPSSSAESSTLTDCCRTSSWPWVTKGCLGASGLPSRSNSTRWARTVPADTGCLGAAPCGGAGAPAAGTPPTHLDDLGRALRVELLPGGGVQLEQLRHGASRVHLTCGFRAAFAHRRHVRNRAFQPGTGDQPVGGDSDPGAGMPARAGRRSFVATSRAGAHMKPQWRSSRSR